MEASARNFLFLCYGLCAAWAILIVYVLLLAGRGKRLQREIESLKRLLEDSERKPQ